MRELPFARLDFERVRAYANERVNETSLRVVAEQVGMNHTTLSNFIHGAVPHPRVRALLGRWYVDRTGETERTDGAVVTTNRDDAVMRAALESMVRAFPESDRPRVRGNLASALADQCAASGMRVSAWLAAEAEKP